jgi:hypothetical protein
MTQLFDVPEDLLEFGGQDWYPVGDYEFEIDESYVNDLGEDEEGNPFSGYVSSDGAELSLRVKDFVPLNGENPPPSENVGQFVRICLEDNGMTYIEVDPTDSEYKQLAKGKRRLVAIARALGEIPSDEFVDQLREGKFKGARIGATFQEWKMGDRKGSFPKKFFAANSF